MGGGEHSQRAGQGGGDHSHHAGNQPAAWDNQFFQRMTAQQPMLGALEHQLQQAVTRAILQALSGGIPGLGGGMGSANPLS